MQAIDELAQLVQQRTWDKELVVWSGPEAKLLPALPGLHVEMLDLLDLFTTWSGLSETGKRVSEIRPHVPETELGVSERRAHVAESGSAISASRDLVSPAGRLIDDDQIRQHLSRSLRRWLQTMDRPAGKRTVLIVRSAGLLARYRVGVRDFYEWFCDDFSMVILLVERPAVDEEWPEEVDCNPNRLVEYFAETGMTKRQFKA